MGEWANCFFHSSRQRSGHLHMAFSCCKMQWCATVIVSSNHDFLTVHSNQPFDGLINTSVKQSNWGTAHTLRSFIVVAVITSAMCEYLYVQFDAPRCNLGE